MKESAKATINYESVKNALRTIDSRFVVFEEHDDAERTRNYCSIRLVLSDKTIDTRRVLCVYFNANSVTIHCAKRFESVCDTMYKLNAKRTEYTLTCKLDTLAMHIHALLAYECARLKMSAYTQSVEVEKKTSATRKASAKAK